MPCGNLLLLFYLVFLQHSSEFYLEVPVAVLVRLLRSGLVSIVVGALNALLVLDSDDSTSVEAMAESGAIEALLELLRSHQCEETAARLLETLLNNGKIRKTKTTKSAIIPLSHYLFDPQSQGQQARLLATLALDDLFQNEALPRTTDVVSACLALVNLLEDQPTEKMKVAAIVLYKTLCIVDQTKGQWQKLVEFRLCWIILVQMTLILQFRLQCLLNFFSPTLPLKSMLPLKLFIPESHLVGLLHSLWEAP